MKLKQGQDWGRTDGYEHGQTDDMIPIYPPLIKVRIMKWKYKQAQVTLYKYDLLNLSKTQTSEL